ncbi:MULTISPECIES: glucoamylase family protein [unclassified Variovorax]|uniref:GH36-type glycosyl hydrolase domain-containing protein n=1 Tax=unclassified Variovorax TaxID=663243 RepID=UPI00257603C2|nr:MULTISPECIES: glucoamylase family protein [unclassified Variovorax]MDM0090377.1 glucoamylase family protein [Variovorax sp. J22G40]MDM0147958.1 glucoamylase family protein [Variovorax sp. J2P1-31]
MTAAAVIARLATLSTYARHLLQRPHAPVPPPIRAELFGTQRFKQHGRSLARAQAVQGADEARASAPFFPRVDENLASLRSAFDYIALISQSGRYVSPAAEWLLDNFHLVEAQLQQIREGVPRSYYARLPKLADAPLAGLPRVYGIAWAYVAHTDSVLNKELFTAFLDAYQDVDELTLGELWALPTTLRVVLLENLRRVAESIAENKVARELAHAVWDAADALSAAELDLLYATVCERGLQASYCTQLWQRLPAERGARPPPLFAWTEANCPNGPLLVEQAQTAQAAANLTVGNIITTLRMIGQVEWVDLIEPVSRSLRVLRELPSFAAESERTRQQITHAMEQVARSSERTERSVAEAVLRLARNTPVAKGQRSGAERTAGYHLFGLGRPALVAALAASRPGKPSRRAAGAPPRAARHWRLPLYLGSIALGTALLLTGVVHELHRIGSGDLDGTALLALLLMAWPLSEAVIALLHRIVAESVRVQALPRLDFATGIPAAHRVLVVIPTLLSSTEANAQLAQRLELHWLANREPYAQFALLTDWADAAQATRPGDDALLADALQRIAALNAAHPTPEGAVPRFLLLHRPRSWCETEQRWIGWERKRGKLEMLLRLLAAGDASGFLPLAPGLRLAAPIPYVLTLDSDTGLPPGTLRELVAIAAHPLNAPQLDADGRRVVAGFGILQPRVVTPLPTREERSAFHWMFAGQCGIDPYSSGASDIYQDLFGSGSFTGKGLLDVQAVHATLDRRLPDGAVLSHDLLEGSVARCAVVSDLVLIEDHPHHAGVSASRIHRWTRGDWQLLPLMLRARRFGIDALGLWKMSDNLRRALVLPASAALLALAVFSQAMPLRWAFAAVVSALAFGPLLGALAGLVPTRRSIELRHFFDVGLTELVRALTGALWQFSQLAAQTRLLLDATLRAAWRLLVSRRRLLEWTTAAQAQAQARYGLWAFVRASAPLSLLCLALAIAALWSPHPLAGGLLFGLWALAPLTAWWASRVPRADGEALPAAQRAYLDTLARDTWRFFEHVVGPEDNHLPPDNLQLEPETTTAHRTSPTNIGMYLLASCCARDFGWLDDAALAARLEATLASVDRLPKHRGHLYNWYDTQTLAVLQPAYVSSVDSGNLAGHLLAVAQACRGFASTGNDDGSGAALQALAARCEALCHGMDFRGLYDAKRHLFHIGLRVDDDALDASYYDLLASESRLLSFLAIAKGDVPRRHWMALGRPFLSVGAQSGLKSWSGSMFEYLMPALVMAEPDDGLLQVANLAAVREQQAFGRAQGLPWGVSESAYFARDHSLAYQYSPFGVPRLALRRTPPTDRVVAPYASAMAAQVAPGDAVANLRRLEALGARGDLGFFDAVDFTLSRQAEGEPLTVVRNFMAHHQGMSLVALCNVLRDGAPQRWFGSAPLVQAHIALLHERTPRQIIGSADPRPPPEPSVADAAPAHQPRLVDPMQPGFQPTHLLSNGRYTVALRASGAGVSRWRSFNVTRWRDDPLRDGHGTFFYVRDAQGTALTSLTALPAPGKGWQYRTRFLADQAQFEAGGPGLQTRITVLISPEDDTELRTVTLHNTDTEARTLELISYFEPVLSNPKADEAHPAFANLFVETRWDPALRALLLSRKPRLHGDAVVAAAHFLASTDAHVLGVDCMADRRAFLGRNHTLATPRLDAQPVDAAGAPVNGLDPIACLRVRLRIAAGATARLSFATTADLDLETLMPRIDRYLQPMHVERAMRMAATLAQVRLRDLAIDPVKTRALQDLTTILTYTTPRVMSDRGPIDLRQIWRFGISGDKPIVLVHIHSTIGMGLLNTLLRAQPWWGFGGVACDLVVLNGEPGSYLMPLQREIEALRTRVAHETQNSFPRNDAAGFYLLRDAEVAASEKAALSTFARAVFRADGRSLEAQVAALRDAAVPAVADAAVPHTPLALRPAPTQVDASAQPPQGGFDAESGEFRFEVDLNRRTPKPWINVIANASFGFQVSESGTGYTWAVNSRMHQLTPWSNDPVQDPAFEHYLLQDLDTRALLPLTPASRGGSAARHRVRHGQGYTVFECLHHNMVLETTFFADRDERMKLVQVQVRNEGVGRRRLRALAMVEWQMGAARGERRTVHSWKGEGLPAVFGQQRESSAGFGGSTAFVALAGLPGALQWTCERSEFFAGHGGIEVPDTLGQRAGSGLDACAAIGAEFTLEAGQGLRFCFMLGQADDAEAATQLARRWQARDVGQALQQARGFWDELLGRLQVRTPDPLFDAMVNRWLVYQTLVCRLWSKAGFYQAGGAFGFRDQLQDAMAFALTDPARLREQILVNAARQFPEGDVQHWWHMPGGAGVRTHFSDDLLWLPYAVAHYVEVSGDATVLEHVVPFIDGPAIPEGAEDAYYAPHTSPERANVYEHGARAIDHSLAVGVHGLPLMGTGDWNDGMNRVGHEGRGESVWLAWFLCSVVERYAPIAQSRHEHARAERWLAARQGWIAALHDAGWDGAWFRRAFFDDGAPLGSAANDECRIDLIAQAWSVLSGASDAAHTQPALAAMKAQLHDDSAGLLRLLHPPLAHSTHNPGYIQAYPPGVRENGGQYAHAAVWGLMAQALSGDTEAAWQSFEGLSPAHRARHATRGPAYELEPYVMAGDIYGAAPYVGRGGWSWYTGSAAWLHRAAIETLLGLVVRGDRLSVTPRVPAQWPGFEMVLRLDGRVITLQYGEARTRGVALAAGEWIDWRHASTEGAAAADATQAVWVSITPAAGRGDAATQKSIAADSISVRGAPTVT